MLNGPAGGAGDEPGGVGFGEVFNLAAMTDLSRSRHMPSRAGNIEKHACLGGGSRSNGQIEKTLSFSDVLHHKLASVSSG
jgi:hypothetical protein